jgi:tetratricopeptide (TPR) repeat protein
MPEKPENRPKEDDEAEFSKLFWAAREEHSRLGKVATANDPAHKAAIAFAEVHGWEWAQKLLEASLLDFAGSPDKALERLRECESLIPEQWHSKFHNVQGGALCAKGEYDKAIMAYRKALDDPKFDMPGAVWYNLGFTLDEKGEYDEAIKAYQKSLDEPGNLSPGSIWNNIGVALFKKGEYDETIKAYRKALDDPQNNKLAVTWVNLANLLVDFGNQKEAEKAFNEALKSSDPQGSDHARARLGLERLKSKIETKSLSPDDRALVEKPPSIMETVQIEDGIIAAIREAGDTQYDKYLKERKDSERDNTLSILRGWSSAVTLLEGSARRWRGGGYFLKWRGYGIVIDPGFDFLRNFNDADYHGREINAVIVSHNHPDHNSDLKDIDDLRYELYKRLASTDEPGSKPYVLLWDDDTAKSTKFGSESPRHQYQPGVMSSGFRVTFNLLNHLAKIPVCVTPFKVYHGNEVQNAVGMVVELLDEEGKCELRLGYTADTRYFPELHEHLKDCDVIIAHISQPSIEELQDASKHKEVHLGYRGTIKLLSECKPKLALIGEFWAGYTDLRISLVKGLRQRTGLKDILPAGLGMHIKLPSLDIECTQCHNWTPFTQVKIAPPSDNFGRQAYLCSRCVIE